MVATLGWLLLAGWAVFVALHTLLSGHTWVWAVPEMVPPIAFAAVPVAAAGVALAAPGPGRGWAALLGLALLAAGTRWNGLTLPTAGRQPAAPTEPAAADGQLVLFVWNTHYWDQGEDAASFLAFLRAQDADAYLLQEHVYWRDGHEMPAVGLDDLAAALPDHAVIADGELVTAVRRRYAPRRRPGVPGTALRTDVSVAGTTVALYNVHMPVQVDLDRSPLSAEFYRVLRQRSERQRRAFRAVGELLRQAPPAFVVGGDFNSSPAMRLMRRLRAGRVDVMRAAGRPYLATWPAGRRRLWRIDWVLASGQLRADWARLVDPAGRSDHDGQLCALCAGPAPTARGRGIR